jgi:hypothetical protein
LVLPGRTDRTDRDTETQRQNRKTKTYIRKNKKTHLNIIMRNRSGSAKGYGWFSQDLIDDDLEKDNLRNAWKKVTYRSSMRGVRNTQEHNVLFSWRNPNPSTSVKSSLMNNNNSDILSSMDMSCCVNGFRIVQYQSGIIQAEYGFIFSYGSISFNSWKCFTEFQNFYYIIDEINRKYPTFTDTIKAWQAVKARKKWFRCFDIPYLIEQSIMLSRFLQSVLHESPTPGFLFDFVQNSYDYCPISYFCNLFN